MRFVALSTSYEFFSTLPVFSASLRFKRSERPISFKPLSAD
jgi:hypothetical protein